MTIKERKRTVKNYAADCGLTVNVLSFDRATNLSHTNRFIKIQLKKLPEEIKTLSFPNEFYI